MKKIVLKNIITIFVMIIVIATMQKVIDLNILPNKYLYLLFIAEFIFLSLSVFLYQLKNKILMILGLILLMISMIGNGFLYYYLNKTNHYINENFAIEAYKVKTKYYVVTSSWNEIKGLEELPKENPVEYYKYSRAVDLALKKLGDYNFISTDNGFDTLVKVRDTGSYLVISKADFEFVLDASNVLENDHFSIINEFDVLEDVKINTETPTSYSIYINGLDYSGNRRDYNLIATINTKTHKVVLTSIPRDYYIDVPFYGRKDSLMALGTVDPEISKEALESLFQTKIDYTLNLYTYSLVKVVDTIGGVEFCSPTSFYTSHDMTLGTYEDFGEKLFVEKGCRTYGGLEALAIARERVKVYGGDRKRQDNCRQLLINIGKKMASITTLSNYSEILSSFDGVYTSNINKTTITNLVKAVIDNPNFEVIEQSVDGVDGKGSGRLGHWDEVWTVDPDMETVNKASAVINEVLNEK